MRRALFAAIFPLPLLIAGCVSDDNAAPSGADSGPVAEDAGPTLDSTVESEASTPDAGPDATAADSAVPDAAVDATPLPVTLTVTNDEGPEQGVLVVFQDATGTVITTATTDATGRVTQQLAADSQVTAVLGTVVSPALVTIQGVQPGDALTAFDTAHLAFANTSVTIDALPDAAPPGTSGYQAYVGNCPQNGSGFTAPPTTFGGIAWPCVAAGKAPLLVASIGSTDGGSNQELGYTYEKGNPHFADRPLGERRDDADPVGAERHVGQQRLAVVQRDRGRRRALEPDELRRRIERGRRPAERDQRVRRAPGLRRGRSGRGDRLRVPAELPVRCDSLDRRALRRARRLDGAPRPRPVQRAP